ncbi:MAG: hypothetical protein ABI354_00905 [Candidatus Saccharimonadales bacterium]
MIAGKLTLTGHPNYDAYHLFVSAVPFMADHARFAANNSAYSYRDFKVGAAVFALNPDTQETNVLAAGNLKAERHKPKVCAEKNALNQAKKLGLTVALGIVVAATTDVELIKGVTNIETPTLHPCAECRDMFDEHPLTRPDTLIVTTGLSSDNYQVHTHAEMNSMYAAHDQTGLQRLGGNNFDDWGLVIANYDNLALAENSLPAAESRRSPAKLAQMAMLAHFL